MVILDTDHLSLLEWPERPVGRRILERLDRLPADQAFASIVSFEEKFRGWLTVLAKAKQLKEEVSVYKRLKRMIELFNSIPLLVFDETSAVHFQKLRKSKIRVGTMDLKIAAIALAHGATLLTRNLRDLAKIPGLQVEDWTR